MLLDVLDYFLVSLLNFPLTSHQQYIKGDCLLKVWVQLQCFLNVLARVVKSTQLCTDFRHQECAKTVRLVTLEGLVEQVRAPESYHLAFGVEGALV